MKRIDLQKIAQAKLDDAILLLRNERFSNAYYLAGYSIELALKACISRQISTDTIPDKNLVNRLYSHNFRDLVGLAGLTKELKQEEALNTNFSMNWALINEWSPDARYTSIDRMSTQYLIEAIKSDDDGVFHLDQEALVKSGHLLLSYLDETNLKPKAAIWVHFTDTDTWRFWIVPANSNNTDKREFYFTVASKISENLEKLLGLDVSYIELVKETHPAIKGLSGMFKVTGLSTVHASANNFNGYFLPDGIILRMDL